MGCHGPPTRGPGFPHRGGLRPPFSQRPPFSGNQNKKRPAQQNDKVKLLCLQKVSGPPYYNHYITQICVVETFSGPVPSTGTVRGI